MKKYIITFAHLLKLVGTKPTFIITTFHVNARSRFGAKVRFFNKHLWKRNKILFISKV